MEHKLSVIITVYNEEKYVVRCIESVIRQTYTNLEIIVVDDGSTDRSLDVCKSFVEKDNRVSVIHKSNGGPMSARKTGIRNATGEYITYVDGDDWLESDLYEKVMKQLGDADICAYGLTCVYDEIPEYNIGDKIPTKIRKDIMANSAESGIYEDLELIELKKKSLYFGELGKFGILPSMCSKVFRKSLIEQNLFKVDDDVRMGDDGCCTFPSICDSKKIVIDNSIVGYIYRKTDTNTITSSYKFEEFNRIEKVFKTLYSAFEERNAEYMMEQLTYYLAFLFRNEMVLELANLKPNNIWEKWRHLIGVKKLSWIGYLSGHCDYSRVDKETEMLIKYINRPLMLMEKWYLARFKTKLKR